MRPIFGTVRRKVAGVIKLLLFNQSLCFEIAINPSHSCSSTHNYFLALLSADCFLVETHFRIGVVFVRQGKYRHKQPPCCSSDKKAAHCSLGNSIPQRKPIAQSLAWVTPSSSSRSSGRNTSHECKVSAMTRTAKRSGSLVNFEILLVGPCDDPNFAPHGVVITQRRPRLTSFSF